MRLRNRLAALAISAAVAAPLSAAVPAAAATPQSASLSITPSQEHHGYYEVVVSGHFNTSTTQTSVGMRLKGDDWWFDDDLGVHRIGQAWNGDFALYALVHRNVLNEDPEGRDEIYAYVSSSTGWSKKTANVNGYF